MTRPRRGSRRSKFNNTRITIDGIAYHSIGEANRHRELILLERGGLISDLKHQVRIPLYSKSETLICRYISDFTYNDEETGESVVEDYKGFETDMFKLKWKWLQADYPQYACKLSRG